MYIKQIFLLCKISKTIAFFFTKFETLAPPPLPNPKTYIGNTEKPYLDNSGDKSSKSSLHFEPYLQIWPHL